MRLVDEHEPGELAEASSQDSLLSNRSVADASLLTGLMPIADDPALAWPDRVTRGRQFEPGAGVGQSTGLRIAIVHEWLDTYAGSERVLEQLLLCFPDADLFAVVDFMSEAERGFLRGRTIKTSLIQRLPFARQIFRHYLGLMPLAVQQLDLSGYDLIISSNHAVAKGVLSGPDQVHISYVHSPMRYAWDLQHQYLKQAGIESGLRGMYARWLFGRLRQWDVTSSNQVDYFVANSAYIARRIQKAYRREATVIHPPVDIDRFVPCHDKEDFFLLACRFVPYKRAEVVVESFRRQPTRRLVVVGSGPENERVRAAAAGAPNIEFKGMVPQTILIDLMQRARGFVFAAEEDFGITLAEVQACGTPVIAYRRGGAAEIVAQGASGRPTGVLFDRQEPESIIAAIERFEALESRLTSRACRKNALRFSQGRFRLEMTAFVDYVLQSRVDDFAVPPVVAPGNMGGNASRRLPDTVLSFADLAR